jgi:hypothetical protein
MFSHNDPSFTVSHPVRAISSGAGRKIGGTTPARLIAAQPASTTANGSSPWQRLRRRIRMRPRAATARERIAACRSIMHVKSVIGRVHRRVEYAGVTLQ